VEELQSSSQVSKGKKILCLGLQCSGCDQKTAQYFVGKPEGNKLLWRRELTWESNIKIGVEKWDVHWMQLALNRINLWVAVNNQFQL
jgi:hypothetical protein